MGLDYIVEYINDSDAFVPLLTSLDSASALALDIETINWWDREAERVSLIQLAYRVDDVIRVSIIDALTGLDLEPLRRPLEMSLAIKAIHNAGFDAVKLARHFKIAVSPIHDTMLAARRSGDKHCSLKAQAETHLGLMMDKREQRSDWSRRPLSDEQLRYAALDAACTLSLYEKQIDRGLRGDYELRERVEMDRQQSSLPLNRPSAAQPAASSVRSDLNPLAFALLGIVAELDGRYSPEQLAASIGGERVGVAGWIIDQALGADSEIDEETAQQEISLLRETNLIRITFSRRLEATEDGAKLWRESKLAGSS